MKKIITGLLVSACFSCNQQQAKQEMPEKKMEIVKDTLTEQLKKLAFSVKTDLVCGMPVTAGVNDTAHYKGKLYGFCAEECKAEFVKNPELYLTAK